MIFYQPIFLTLVFFYKFFNNLGWAIICLTVLIRLFLFPFSLPMIPSAKKMKKLQPELEKIKKKFGKDKVQLQKEQIKLFQKYGINPATGCFSYIIQFFVLVALYQSFRLFLEGKIDNLTVNTHFLWLDLAKPDPLLILPFFAGLFQFFLSKTMGLQKKDDPMVYLFPLMTFLFGAKLPAGLALYWLTTTIFSLFQQSYFKKRYEEE